MSDTSDNSLADVATAALNQARTDSEDSLTLYANTKRDEADGEAKRQLAHKAEDTRAKTTLLIVKIYVVSIAVVVASAAIMAVNGSDMEGIKVLDEIIKGALLPVVTFVLGFYFAGKN